MHRHTSAGCQLSRARACLEHRGRAEHALEDETYIPAWDGKRTEGPAYVKTIPFSTQVAGPGPSGDRTLLNLNSPMEKHDSFIHSFKIFIRNDRSVSRVLHVQKCLIRTC